MNQIVLDASIALKWFLKEAGTQKAFEIQKQIDKRSLKAFVPQIFFFEIANVIKTKSKSTSSDVKKALKIIFNLPFFTKKTDHRFLLKSNHYAQKYNLSIYDASYLALAKIQKIDFITADQKLVKKVNLKFVKLLKEL